MPTGVGILSNLLVRAAPSKRASQFNLYFSFFDEQMIVERLLQVKARGLGECPAAGQYDK